MKFKDRAITAYKVLTSQNLGNSISSQVLRNYQKGSAFQPTRQLTGITYKAIDKIGLSLSVYEPQVKKRNGDVYVNHPLIALFKNPNPIQRNPSDFIHMFGMLFEIYGETFWYLARGESTGKIKEVYLLNPAQMELVIDNGELVGYKLHKNNGEQVPFTVDEIYHDKRPNPFNEWRGMSVMEKASVYIDTEITTSIFTLNYMKNNASPSGIVSLPDMDKDAFKQFAAQWREGYEGPENAGKTAFIRGGEASFKAVGATLKDIDQEITRKMAKDDVLLMLEVPKELLGMTADSGFGRNTIEAFSYVFAKEKLEPMMRRLDRIYAGIYQMQSGTKEDVTITHASPVPEDKEFVHKQNKDLANVALTVNEIRERMGLPPLPDKKYDDIIPDNKVAQTTEPTKAAKVVLKKSLTKAQQVKKLNEEQEQFRSELVKTNDIYAKKVKAAISKFAQNQEDQIIDKINATSKAFEDWLFNIKESSEELASVVTPVIIDLMEAQGEDVASFITGELLTISPEMRATVEQSVKRIAGIYNEDTLRALEATLSEGQTQGESLAKLKKRVEGVYTEAKGYRAERIARTESLKASNRTAETVYKQNGYTEVQWFVNPGACEFCQTYSGRTKSIGGVFTPIGEVVDGADGGQMRIEYDDISVPPLHPNCTCSLVPVGKKLEE